MLYATASQTVGPYLHIGLSGLNCADLTADAPELAGQRIVIEGRVTDGLGAPVPDGMVEIWQANPAGRYRHPEDTRELPLVPGFTGFGRVPTAEDGSFRFVTVKPGAVPGEDGKPQAPHIVVSVFMRGLLRHVATRMYFPDEAAANAADGVLARVPADRRGTLIAAAQANGTLRWDVVLQGPGETVFFDI
ncbi:protocatechuate 3,4-dioxygenase subunit alpha [Cupriavidus taiwanensis]|uniref:Protocatechuate 3,4-dioxygenase alpha chain n=1 Tax=Cupriavidus taiwanensis TaxID=164546 RepID=A0A375CDB5_9BURK|nr:protocatechuate 3,4-dioxygenase subunit alpha [Cupriavidus taiwanensis]MDK3021104.1 protocatechuate 3,4-dioxygenase subunit alpha [Cupriavidus taiwanensis]NSX16595.1 protocatechuate 3,4-dioxygenase subunit alpha [Cupriavidus taiwanensis]SOY67868.1 Protocatechuate 3,4-dioxygenase alpha chain [Cupriavidus taiwanensis]